MAASLNGGGLGSSTRAVQRAAFAYITESNRDELRILLRWNNNWQMYNFIGGKLDNHKGDQDDFVKTLQRELFEETGLNVSAETYSVHQLKELHLRQYSEHEKREKNYHFCVFEVRLHSEAHLEILENDQKNILITLQEINKLKTETGFPISPTTRYILAEIGIPLQ